VSILVDLGTLVIHFPPGETSTKSTGCRVNKQFKEYVRDSVQLSKNGDGRSEITNSIKRHGRKFQFSLSKKGRVF
jgi:hypothetical protein